MKLTQLPLRNMYNIIITIVHARMLHINLAISFFYLITHVALLGFE